MILILAQREDAAAAALAQRWSSRGATLMVASDLSQPGWELHIPARAPSRFVACGHAYSSADIAGVLTCLPATFASELDHIALEDQAYVSSEMTAFLTAWLSSLACPVLNRPTPGSLGGPNWRIEQWIHLAARLGIPVHPIHRSTLHSEAALSSPQVSVTVIGKRCLGGTHPSLAARARRLAAAASVDMLEVCFDSDQPHGRLCGVSVAPDVSNPKIADAMLEYFDSESQRG